jgi:hypothetical protein
VVKVLLASRKVKDGESNWGLFLAKKYLYSGENKDSGK